MNHDQCERCQNDEVFRDGLCKTCWWMEREESNAYKADIEYDERKLEDK